MRTPVVRDLFLKFMGLTFISGLIGSTWQAAMSVTSMGMMGSGVPALVITFSGLLIVAQVSIFGLLAWLFLFRTDAVARAFWPRERSVGNQVLPGDGALTVGFVVLLFGLWLLIPGIASLLPAGATVWFDREPGSMSDWQSFTRTWGRFIGPVSKVLVGAVCVRWPRRIESLIVRSWETKPIFHIDIDDSGDDDEREDVTPS